MHEIMWGAERAGAYKLMAHRNVGILIEPWQRNWLTNQRFAIDELPISKVVLTSYIIPTYYTT